MASAHLPNVSDRARCAAFSTGFLAAIVLLFVLAASVRAQTPAPITYRVTFPEPEHHWMQVEVTFPGLGTAPLKARMSRSSPGRYAVHEFGKNVFWVEAFNGAGRKLSYTRPDVDGWDVAGHDGTVRLVYKIFGDHADGTYMAVDTTHAHLNMPAAFMWAAGLEARPMRITFVPPAGSNWRVGTQLFTTNDAFSTAGKPSLSVVRPSLYTMKSSLPTTYSQRKRALRLMLSVRD